MQKKETIEIAVTGLLVMALFVFIARAVKRVERLRQKPAAAASTGHPQAFPTNVGKEGGHGFFERLEAQAEGLALKRDPFSESLYDASGDCPAGLCLKGIVWSAQDPSAIINDKIVKVGDEIEGDAPARVVEIAEREVVLIAASGDLIRLHLD